MKGERTDTQLTKIEKHEQERQIWELSINGLTATQIKRHLEKQAEKAGKTPVGLSEHRIRQALARQEEALAKEARNINKTAEIGRAKKRYTQLHALALQAGNYAEARAAQKALDDLLGLQAPKQTQVDITTGGQRINQPDYSKLTDEELATMHAITAKLQAPEPTEIG